jgi:GNAT superfamily N-acetyltransferase
MSNGYMVRPPRGDWEAGLSVEATMAGSAENVGSVKDRSVDRSTALISELYVAPTHRRRGVSRKLMQAVLRAARGAGIYVLRLRRDRSRHRSGLRHCSRSTASSASGRRAAPAKGTRCWN